MRVELLNAYVRVYVRVIIDPDADRVVDRFRQVSLYIDEYGHVDFGLGRYRFPEDRAEYDRERDVVDMLVEEGMVEWRRIGPEDSELYLTPQAERHFAPQMAVLGDWHEMPLEPVE
jgi:hypothetical protein